MDREILLRRKQNGFKPCLSVLLSADVWSAKSYPFNVELCLESVTPKCFQAEFLDELSNWFLEDVGFESEYSDGDLSSPFVCLKFSLRALRAAYIAQPRDCAVWFCDVSSCTQVSKTSFRAFAFGKKWVYFAGASKGLGAWIRSCCSSL